jgi:site-specific DNA-cytosine methylase
MGKRRGVRGVRFLVFCQVMLEMLLLDPDVFVIENVLKFVASLVLMPFVAKWFDVEVLNICPAQLGFPQTRPRAYIVGLRRFGLLKTSSAISSRAGMFPCQGTWQACFHAIFNRPTELRGSIFFEKEPTAMKDDAYKKMVSAKGFPQTRSDGSKWPWHMLANVGHRGHVQMAEDRLMTDHGTTFCDLNMNTEQSNNYANASLTLPALLTRSRIYNFAHERVLSVPMHFEAQGFAIVGDVDGEPPERPSHIREAILSGESTEPKWRKAAGNAFHKGVFTSVLLFALGATELTTSPRDDEDGAGADTDDVINIDSMEAADARRGEDDWLEWLDVADADAQAARPGARASSCGVAD